MKHTFTRSLSMLLFLVLTFGLCAGMVQATAAESAKVANAEKAITEKKTASTNKLEIVASETNTPVSSPNEGLLTPYRGVNPIYGNTVERDSTMLASAASLATPSTYHTSVASLLKEARQQAVVRDGYFELGLKTTEDLRTTIIQTINDGLYAHTGNPKEGDYILWNGSVFDYDGTWSYNSSNRYYTYEIQIAASYYTSAAQEQAVDAEVKRLLNTLPVSGVSDYKKVKAVYDYMCKNIVYDYAGLNAGSSYCHTSHSAFIAHKTVCQGYASMFYRMMLEMGIDCRLIAGDANSYSTGPDYGNDEHGWNIVKLNGKYYNLDATWDAEAHPNGQNYEFFLVCDANFPRHQPWSQYMTSTFKSQYPKATKDFNPATDDTAPAKSGWVLENNKWYYYQNGVKKTGWLAYGSDWYYLDGNGAMMTGWLQYGSIWYYFLSDGKMATGKVTIGNEVHIFDASGVWKGKDASATVTAGWKQEGGKWYYYKNGAKVTGWLDLNGTWYYFKTSGEMVTGWLEYGPVWYYFNTNGDMRLGWLTYGGKNYYFDKATTNYGRMAVNKWIQDSNNWYYFDANGYMVTGTVTIGGKQHKFSSTGVWEGEVVTTADGWKQESGKWYYYKNGAKVKGWQTISGSTYYFDSTGAMKTGWLNLSGSYYYFDANGVMQTGFQEIGGKWYAFNNSGRMLTGWIEDSDGNTYYAKSDGTIHFGWLSLGGEYYFFDNDGVMAIGWWEIDGEIYYFDHNNATLGQMWYSIWITTPDGSVYYAGPDGALYRGGWYTIGGKSYYFYSDGECSNPPSFY